MTSPSDFAAPLSSRLLTGGTESPTVDNPPQSDQTPATGVAPTPTPVASTYSLTAAGDLAANTGTDGFTVAGDTVTLNIRDLGKFHYTLSHVTFTSNVVFTTTSEATATLVVSSDNIVVAAGPGLFIDYFCPRLEPSGNVAQTFSVVLVRHDVTHNTNAVVGTWASPDYDSALTSTAGTPNDDQIYVLRLGYLDDYFAGGIADGTYRYDVKAYSSNANGGTMKAGAGGSGTLMPGYIRVTYDNA